MTLDYREIAVPDMSMVPAGRRRASSRIMVLAVSILLLAAGQSEFSSGMKGFSPEGVTAEVGWAAAKWGDAATDARAKNAKGKNVADRDAGSLATIGSGIGARDLWQKKDTDGRAITGQGVTVAL